MKRDPSQQDIAKIVGCSQRTVASVVGRGNQRSRVGEAKRKRILEVAAELGYRPHFHAQMLKGGSSGLIGVIAPLMQGQSSLERMYHFSVAVERSEFNLHSQNLIWQANDLRDLVDNCLQARVEGIVFTEGIRGDYRDCLGKLKAYGVPHVFMTGHTHGERPEVAVDCQGGLLALMRHLAKCGRKRIACELLGLSEKNNRFRKFRRKERRNALVLEADRLGVGIEFIETPADPARFDLFEQGRTTAQELIDRGPPFPDALMCHNDYSAQGAYAVLVAEGLRVPDDFALTGFDDAAVGRHLPVQLTTVRQPSEAVAEHAFEVLRDAIRREGRFDSDYQIKLPFELVVRESCGEVRRTAGHGRRRSREDLAPASGGANGA